MLLNNIAEIKKTYGIVPVAASRSCSKWRSIYS